MKEILLTRGQFAIVDDVDFEQLSSWKWCAIVTHNTWYARRGSKSGSVLMHRVILELQKGDKRQTDHINHNGLDNRRCNLRVVTGQQNQWNLKNVKGYSWHNQAKKWESYIRVNKKRIYLGLFSKEQEAHQAYLDAKKKYHSF